MLIPTLFASLVVALAGALVSRAALARTHRQELAELEEEMMDAVEERYQAYLELESTVHRILARLDQLDAETTEQLTRTGMRLNDLGRTLAACSSDAQGAEDTDLGDKTAWLVDATPKFAARPAASSSSNVDIKEWPGRFEGLAAEKRAEFQRQEKLLAELTARFESLQSRVSQREQMLQGDDEQGSAQLAHEVAIWRARHLALEQETAIELAAVRARAEQATELEADAFEARGEVQAVRGELEATREEARATQAELETRIEELRSEEQAAASELDEVRTRHAEVLSALEWRLSESEAREAETYARHLEEVQGYENRIAELEPLVGQERDARAKIESLEQKLSNQRQRQEQLGAEFERERDGLTGELEATRAARAQERRKLEQRIADLQREVETLDATRERVQVLEIQLAESERSLQEVTEARTAAMEREAALETTQGRLENELTEAHAETERWRTATRAAESERDAKLAELSEQFDALEAVTATLRDAATEHLGRIANLETEERRLSDNLAKRTGDLEHTTERLHEAERTLHAAFALLAKANLPDNDAG